MDIMHAAYFLTRNLMTYVKCVGGSVVVISIKNDRYNFISRRVASVPTRVVLSARVSPLRTASLVKLRYRRNINIVDLLSFPLAVISSPEDKSQANVVRQSSGIRAVLSCKQTMRRVAS